MNMKKTRRLHSVLLAAVLLLAFPTFGWLDEGHMAVAYVAYQALTPGTRARVKVLLEINPRYKAWKKSLPHGTSPADQDMMIFMLAATWPDEIKGLSSYKDVGPDNGDTPPPNDPTASQNIGYKDHLRHRYWHFVDTPFSQDGTDTSSFTTPSPNAQTEIATFRAALASTQADKIKSYDLVWLMHLVGDVHQPLHCTTRISAGHSDGDQGGNKVDLTCPASSTTTPCTNELHYFWDSLPGTSKAPSTAVTTASALPPADGALASNLDAAVWIAESFQDAKDDVYVAPIGPGWGPFTTTPAYESASQDIAKQRVALAGARLAKILNSELN